MSETKFTPGPWKVTVSENGIDVGVDGLDGETITGWIEPYDAHLIAAAPELYGVVEKLAKWNKDYPSARVYGYGDIKQIAEEMDAINAQAIAALAKARGEA